MKDQAAAALMVLLSMTAAARGQPAEYPGPYVADVVRVVDADTLRVQVKIWPTVSVLASIRLRGVDTPESGSRARCAAERQAAARATDYVRRLLPAGSRVRLEDVRLGKYAGRVVATVKVRRRGRWYDLAGLLKRRNLGRAYGGGHRGGWCAPRRSTGKEDRIR